MYHTGNVISLTVKLGPSGIAASAARGAFLCGGDGTGMSTVVVYTPCGSVSSSTCLKQLKQAHAMNVTMRIVSICTQRCTTPHNGIGTVRIEKLATNEQCK
jgi:hypothetical protein